MSENTPADIATTEAEAQARIDAHQPGDPVTGGESFALMRDKAWHDAAMPREGDRIGRDPLDLLSAPQRRLQALADAETGIIREQRDAALRTLAAISRAMATTADGLAQNPDLSMTHGEAAKMLTDFLTVPQ